MFSKISSKIKKNKFTVLITFFVIALISITLGSALINSVLTLTGTTKVKESKWWIHFEFVDNINASNPNTNSQWDARITDPTTKKENIAFTTNFKNVGDFYEFNVYTWNEGTIDAVIDSINLTIPDEYKNNIKYKIYYDDQDIQNDDTITYDTDKIKNIYDSRYDYSKITVDECDPLYSDTMRKLVVRVEYKKKIDNLNEDKNINFNLKINYVQEKTGCTPPTPHVLKIRPNGGVYNGSTRETKETLNKDEEYTVTKPTRDMYNFEGWEVLSPTDNGTYTLTEISNTDKFLFTMGDENVILQARWKEGNYVARIMNKYYATIQEAFDDVDSKNWEDNTVWLLKDTTEYPVNRANNKFIFNLDNHIVTGTIQNNAGSDITLINGVIRTEDRLTDEQKQGLSLNKKHEAAVINYGTLSLGIDDPIVNIENSITLAGNEYGLLNFYDNGSKFNFYDGVIEGDIAIEEGYNKTPDNYYVFVDHNDTKNCQRAYLIPNPNRAVAKTTTKGTVYYYNMQDAINSVETYKRDKQNLTDNDYIIIATRDFEAAYPLKVASQRVFIDVDGKDISTGESITNNGYLKIFNSDVNKSVISVSSSITNNKNLVIDNVSITGTTDDNVIINNKSLSLSKSTITGKTGNGIYNDGEGTISADSNTIIKSESTYGLYNNTDTLNIENATIYGIYNNSTMSLGDNVVVKKGLNTIAINNTGLFNMNNGTVVEEDEENYIIYNRGIFNLNGGTISNKALTISNYDMVNINGGTISSDSTAISGRKINVTGGTVSSINGHAINGDTINVSGGTITSTNGNAINADDNVTVSGGTISSENAIGVYSREKLNVIDGNIHGHTYGLYGHEVSIKDGKVDSDEIGVYAYLYTLYNKEYPGSTGMTGGEITAVLKGVESDYYEMTEGIIKSDNGPGLTVKRSATVTGGTIIGETYGILNKGNLTLGNDEGNISIESPLVIGKSYGLFAEENTTTNFYDGILKGQIDAHYGEINGTPVGAIVTYGNETIDEVEYDTAYLISYKNWLRVGEHEFNTINAASSYIQTSGNDGDIIEVFDNAPDLTFKQQFVEGDKKVKFDLAGYTLKTTQAIYNNGTDVTIIDSSSEEKGTIICNKGVSIYNNLDKKLTLDGGNYISHTDYFMQNDGTLVTKKATFNVDKTAIFNRANLIIDGINIETSINGIENDANIEYVDHSIYDTGLVEHSRGNIVMNDGVINASNYGIYSGTKESGTNTINGGTIHATKRSISVISSYVIVNGGTIIADDEYAIYNHHSQTTINDGNLKSNTNVALFVAGELVVNGGNVTGKTYGAYTDEYCSAYEGCSYPKFTVTGGYIKGETKDGIRTLGSELIITGGTVEGKLDGVRSDAKNRIGDDEGAISTSSPVLIGHTNYGLEVTKYTAFYDGILKGIDNGYHGLISIIPTGSVIIEDFEYINRVKYEVRYLGTKDNWLQIGDDESRQYNSLNAAYAAMGSGDTTIKVVAAAYIDFKQKIPAGKKVIFDLNGYSVILTQPIEIENNTTIIDSGDTGYLNNIRDVVLKISGSDSNVSINSGTFNSEVDLCISNAGTLTINNGTFTTGSSDGTITSVVDNTSSLTINGGTFTGKYGINNRGSLHVKGGTITATTHNSIVNNSNTIIDGGTISGRAGINNEDGTLTVNDGIITSTASYAIQNDDTTIINGGTITAESSYAIRNVKSNVTVNGGVITSLNGTGIENEGLWYSGAILTVNGGTITGSTHGIRNSDITSDGRKNEITINDGLITGNNGSGLYTTAPITKVLGGTLIGSTYGVYSNSLGHEITEIGSDDDSISIDSPVLKGELYGLYIENGKLYYYDGILKGRTERVNDYERITKIPEGSEIIFDSEVIDEKTYLTAYLLSEQEIARILTKNKECTKQSRITQDENKYCIYNNLQSAIDDADDGETIQILETARTIPIYYDVTINKNITLDLNGKTITTTKNIVNEAETKIIDSTKTNGTLKTSSANYLITNRNSLICEDVKLINNNARNYVIHSIAPLSLKNINVSATNGIYCSDTLTINNSSIITSSTAIDARGKVTINGGNYRGGSYSIYMDTNSDSEIKNVTLTGAFYNSGSNNTSMKNSTITGVLNNYANMTILKGDTPTILRNGFVNYGTIEVNEANVSGNVRNYGTTTINKSTVRDGRITNTRLFTINDSEFSISIMGYNYDSIDYALYNTGTFNMNNTKVIIRAAKYSLGLDNSGTFNMNENSEISITGGTNTYGIRNKGTGKVNISSGNIIVSGNDKAFGIYSTGENAKVTMVSGKVNVTAPTSYGAYLNYGTFEIGVKEVGEYSGTASAEVSLTNPELKALGNNGIGVKKVNGLFNFYDGIIWGSKFSKPETTSNVEYKWEATTYIDAETGYEYTILEYMPFDYNEQEVAYLRGTVACPTIQYCIDNATEGDTIKLVRSTTEENISIPANKNIVINLNKYTITGKITNDGTVNIYNGTLNNSNDSTLVNNGTFVMGDSTDPISSANIRIISDKTAVVNNGTFNMYDGYIEGNPSINGSINTIPPLSRIRTSNTGQSERKTLQSLDENSIINGDTDLIITIDPNTGYYDNRNVIQEVYLQHLHSYNLNDHTIKKTGCDFDGWEVSEPEAYNDGVITANLSDITVKAKWKVKDTTVAKIGTEYYNTLADAIFHAKKGDKVELLKDTTEDITNDKDISIDLGGYTITGSFINTATLKIDNGIIRNEEEDGIGLINKKSLTMGNISDEVNGTRVQIIGQSVGLQNDGMFNFYDGFIQATIPLNGIVNNTPQGYYVYNKSVEENNVLKQRVFLDGEPDNAIAETRTGGKQYFFNLNDAINTSALTGYEIYLLKDINATYEIKVPNDSNIVINFEGKKISTGNPITNNGTLKLYDTTEEKGSISIGNTITNNGTIIVDEINITGTSATANLIESAGSLTINNAIIKIKNDNTNTTGNVINSSGPLTIKNTTITAEEGYAVYSTGTLDLIGNNELNSNKYALYNAGNELTLNNNVIKGIETTKNITVEEGATIVGNSGSGALVGRSTCDLVVNGGTITASDYGVYSSGTNSTITINGGTINSGTNGLYCNGSDNTITINGGTIDGSYHGVYLKVTKCNYVMNGGSVLALNYGLVDDSSYNTITINDGTISATNGDGIRENVSRSTGNNQVAFPVINIKGGLIVGSRYGLFNHHAFAHISGGEVRSTGNYAIYNSSWGGFYLEDNGFINSPNSSGIYNDSGVEISGGRIYAGGQYGVYNYYTGFSMSGGKIETPSMNANSIRVNGTNNISGGEIISGNVGILNNSSATVNINGNTSITGNNYGISQTTNGTINLGASSDSLSITKPYVSGGLYGIYKTNGSVNFYNGKLRGYTNGYNNSLNELRKNMDVYTTYENIENEEKIKTYSTTNVSANAESNKVKSGNGHARITYIGESTDTCTKGSVTDISYSGHEETFTPTCSGIYQLEVWGASGGSYNSTYHGGYGGYSTGIITLSTTETLYIYVGGQGNNGTSSNIITGGYNGGGNGNYHGGSGGGATHIATVSGLLSTLENNKDAILIVAGGGGGGAYTNSWNASAGGSGGGYIGGNASENAPYNDTVVGNGYGLGGTQIEGGITNVGIGGQGTFGQGGTYIPNSTSYGSGGGGGGFYGGGASTLAGAGGGSGYIANDRLSDAYMYGYNVEPSSWIINYLVPKEGYLRVGEQIFNNFEDATEAVGESGTIYLIRDVSLTEEVTFPENKNITFDLQGHTLSMTKALINRSNLTVISTGSETKGKIYTNGTTSISTFANTTLEDVIIENASNSAVVPSGSVTLNINGTTEIKSVYSCVSLVGASTVNLNSGTLTSTGDYGMIYSSANNAVININGGTITSKTYGISTSNSNSVTLKMNDGTISSKYGIYSNASNSTITINDGIINASSFVTYNDNRNTKSTLNINGGTLTGTNGIYTNSHDVNISGGTINVTNTNNNNYAVQVVNGTTNITGGEIISNGSGLLVGDTTIKNATITAKASNGYGINTSSSLSLENVIINTTGSSSYGIYGSPELTFAKSTINAKNIGINTTGNTTSIKSGSIISEGTGIVINGSSVVVNMGESDEELSIEKPYITGGNYAINNQNGTFNFYNGRLRGETFGYNGNLNSIRKGKQVYTEYEGGIGTPNATLSTDNVSNEAISRYAKIGNGHARITYMGETNETCENGDITDIVYTGSESTFNAPCTGKYKLEVWGASGGKPLKNGEINNVLGYGGYAKGSIELTEGDLLYINVGGQGQNGTLNGCAAGGYNGGGKGTNDGGGCGTPSDNEASAGGGGATHIATQSGLLSQLENNKDSVIIVAGGGGGGSYTYTAGSGGGINGGITDSTSSNKATQTTGYAFGQGQDGNGYADSDGVAGGGGGWYGGYSNNVYRKSSGGGGSGYTGHKDLSDTIMYGYNVDTTDVYVINYLVTKDGFLEVNDEVYNSFEEALGAIEGDTGTIKVLNSNSVQEDVTIPSGKTITLDLNSKSLNMTKTIVNNGNLNIVDNSNKKIGKIDNSATITLNNRGNLVVKDVEISTTSSNYVSLYGDSGTGTITIKGNSKIKSIAGSICLASEQTLNIESGIIEASNGYAVAFDVGNITLNMTGGTINASLYGIYTRKSSATNTTMNISNATISGNNAAIYSTTTNNTISLDTVELSSSDTGSALNTSGNNALIDIKDSTITGTNGIYINSENNTINIDNSIITGTTSEGIRDQKNKTDNSTTLNIKNSTITGKTNGIYIKYNNINIDNSEIKTISTDISNYALYTDGTTSYIINNTIINSPNASGIYLFSSGDIIESKINAGGINGYGINGTWINGKIESSKVNVPSGYGINVGSSASKVLLTLDDSKIDAIIGINLTNASSGDNKINIYGGKIYGDTYGIYQTQNYDVIFGDLNRDNSITAPYIEGGTYGLYKTNGTFSMYSGKIKGFTAAYSGAINNVRSEYELYEEDNELTSREESIRTVSTTDVSSEAESNKAKMGNGHARIIYIGNEGKDIKLSKDYDDPFDCSRLLNKTYNFDAKTIEQKFITKCAGTYKLEVWGAQGGYNSSSYPGGYGGYSTGTINLNKNQTLYLNVGTKGKSDYTQVSGGYNGGGTGTGGSCSGKRYSASGGGATHIATSSGLLSSLENNKSSVIIVAGGGGGSHEYNASIGSGASAGGYIGNTATWTNNGHSYYIQATGGTQSEGGLNGCSYRTCNQSSVGLFGQGGNFVGANCSEGAGGGGGYYGGGFASFAPGAGGSGFINNDNLSNKSMYCYGCQESDEEGTKTISTTTGEQRDVTLCPSGYSSTATSKCAKAGNGYAKITLVSLDSSENKATINFISENGTIETTSKQVTKGSEIGTLETPTTTGNIVFDGWYIDSNYNTRIDSTYIVEKSMNVYAKYKYVSSSDSCSITPGTIYNSNYSGSEDTYTVPCTGEYQLEVWGAQGGNADSNYIGGYGGYSSGKIILNKDQILHINVGGQGVSGTTTYPVAGGYNGGGGRSNADKYNVTGTGGGATHIATSSGLLSSLENNKSSIIIVAGGGGGGYRHDSGGGHGNGGSGGGYIGGSGTSSQSTGCTGGTQTQGGLGSAYSVAPFGQGGTNSAGGGGGYYGGGAPTGGDYHNPFNFAGAGGGSGYTGYSDLYDKVMYGYNVSNIYSSIPAKVVYLVREGEYFENTNTHVTYTSLETALSEANENDTIKLTRNATNNTEFVTTANNVTIDLNGYSLNMMKHFQNNGNITITNNKSNSTSSITTTLDSWLISNSGTLNMSNVTVSGAQFIANNMPATFNANNVTFNTTGTAIITEGVMELTDCSITSPIGINNRYTTANMKLNNTTINSSNQAIVNVGTMTITNSNITGTNYAIYDNGTKTSTITGSTLSSSSTVLYNYSTATININTSDLTGNINNTQTNGTISIIGDSTNKNNSIGTISNTGTMTIKHMDANYTSNSNSQDQMISNSGSLTIENSNVTYENTYSGTYNATYSSQGSALIRNTGTINSTSSNYKLFNDNKKLSKHLIGIYNDSGIVNLTSDTLTVYNGYKNAGIYTLGSHTTTINNTNFEMYNTYSSTSGYDIAIANQAGTTNVTGGNIYIHDVYDAETLFTAGTITTNGVTYNISSSNIAYVMRANISNSNYSYTSIGDTATVNGKDSSGIIITNGNVNVTNSNYVINGTTSANGATVNNGKLTIKSGSIKANAPTTYGVKATNGTVILGEYDSTNNTNEADVSITNPHIEAIGTTSGIGVALGSARFEYYDGIIIGSTSARVAGEYIHATQDDFIEDTHDHIVDGVKQYEYSILKYNR